MLYENIMSANIQIETTHLLRDIREPVWSYFRSQCPSLLAMDCNAQFSEIFQSKNFGPMNDFEKTLFTSVYRFELVYERCSVNLSSDSEIFVQFVTLSDINSSGFYENNWPQYITYNNSARSSLQCGNCETLADLPSPSLISPAEVLFVEFGSDAINVLKFHDNIQIVCYDYKLKGLVRCSSHHFTCAISHFDHWHYFDDLCDSVIAFSCLQELFARYPYDWFFGVYTSSSQEDQIHNTKSNTDNLSSCFNAHSSGNTMAQSHQPCVDLFHLPARDKSSYKERKKIYNHTYYQKRKMAETKLGTEHYHDTSDKKIFKYEPVINEDNIQYNLDESAELLSNEAKSAVDDDKDPRVLCSNSMKQSLQERKRLCNRRYYEKNIKRRKNFQQQVSLNKNIKSTPGMSESDKATTRIVFSKEVNVTPKVTNFKMNSSNNTTFSEKTYPTGAWSTIAHPAALFDNAESWKNFKKFHQSMQMMIYQCTICKEAWPLNKTTSDDSTNYVC